MTSPRAHALQLLDAHPWRRPSTLADAQTAYTSLPPLWRKLRTNHGYDRVAKLPALRLEMFLAHWPTPPSEDTLFAFCRDMRAMVRHDIPRIRHALEWAPPGTELPEQRTPRLGVVGMGTSDAA